MKLFTNTWWMGMVLAMACAGCTKGASVSSSSTMPTGGGTAAGTTTGGGAGAPGCATPQDHCLDAADLLVSEAFERNYVAAQVGKQTAGPNAAGEATYTILANGATKTSRVAYKSHRAAPQEIAIGTLVAAHEATDSNGVYRAPASREEAMQNAWFVARIVSVDPVPQGHVILSGGYRVSTENLRVVEGDTGPRLQAPGAEDKSFVKPDHWMVADGALPAEGYVGAHVALAIQPPSAKTREEGEFLITFSGERQWSKHAWKTRAANAAEIKLGVHVVALDASAGDGGYRPPNDRVEALHGAWFIAKVTDTSEAYKGIVTLSGDYRAQIAGLRVLVK